MRNLKRNQQRFYYSVYMGKVPILDENGDYTGEEQVSYLAPVLCYANISPARGESSDAVFGKEISYSRTIVTCDTSLELDEYSRIWIESEPVLSIDGTADGDSADYSVVAVARSLNSVVYALKRLTKSVEV